MLQEAEVAREMSGIQRVKLRTHGEKCSGGDQVQIPRYNLCINFLSKEQVAKGTVTPAMPRSSNFLLH